MKKAVNVPDDIDARRLKELAASSFGMKPEVNRAKCFDKEFEEWVMIPDDFVPNNMVRSINIVEVASPI